MKEGLNLTHLAGYVKDTPVLYKADKSQQPVLRFKLIVPNKIYDGRQKTWKPVKDLINVAVWGWRGQNLAKLLRTGSHIYVSGPLRYSTFHHKNVEAQRHDLPCPS